MNLADRLSLLRTRADGQRDALDRQKKTETALVLPFFDALGYDPFDVRDVEPEARLDEEDDTVDYLLKRDGTPLMLVECMAATTSLGDTEGHVPFRPAESANIPVVVCTNGLRFQFFVVVTDDEARADGPVLDFHLLDHDSGDVDVLRQFARPVFDADEIRAASRGHTRTRQVREYLERQREAPDSSFVQFVATQVCGGSVPEEKLDQFRPVVQAVLDELLGQTVDERTPLSAREESPVPPNGEAVTNRTMDEQEQTGVFGKNIVKRVLDDF